MTELLEYLSLKREMVALAENTFHASRYGATGNGARDDTSDINKAITQANSAGGGIVALGRGTYLVTQILLKSNVFLVGAGVSATTIKKAASSEIPAIQNDDAASGNSWVGVSNLTIDGNRGNQSPVGDGNAMGIRFNGVSNGFISDVYIKDCATDGIYLTHDSSSYSTFCDNIYLHGVHITNSRRLAFTLISGRDIHSSHCSFDNSTGTPPEGGFDAEPNYAGSIVYNVTFAGCSFDNNGRYGAVLSLQNMQTVVPTTVYFDRCSMSGNGRTGIFTSSVINEDMNGEIVYRDCVVRDNEGEGFYSEDKSKYGPRVKLIDCFFRNNSSGTMPHPDTSRGHIKIYCLGNDTHDVGGYDIIRPVIIETKTNMAGLVLNSVGAGSIDDVVVDSYDYTNSVGTLFWQISDYKRLTVIRQLDKHWRLQEPAGNEALNQFDNYSIFSNRQAGANVQYTLPSAKMRLNRLFSAEFRIDNGNYDIIVVAPTGDSFVGGFQSLRASGVGNSVLVWNVAIGKWGFRVNGSWPGVWSTTDSTAVGVAALSYVASSVSASAHAMPAKYTYVAEGVT